VSEGEAGAGPSAVGGPDDAEDSDGWAREKEEEQAEGEAGAGAPGPDGAAKPAPEAALAAGSSPAPAAEAGGSAAAAAAAEVDFDDEYDDDFLGGTSKAEPEVPALGAPAAAAEAPKDPLTARSSLADDGDWY